MTTATTHLATALIALVALLLLPASTHAQTFSCTDFISWDSIAPRAGVKSPERLAFVDPAARSSTILLTNTAAAGQLCTLFAITYSDNYADSTTTSRFYIPVGRSYDGHDWERVAGKHTDLDYGCANGLCSVTLPNAHFVEYYMAAYKYELTGPQAWARFMEKASFGATAADTAGKAGTVAEMAAAITAWNTKEPTSHREYFRSRLNPRSLEVYKYGLSGPHACDQGSYWRKFAFTRKDKIMSVGPIMSDWPMTMHNVTLEARTDGEPIPGFKWAWVYAGHVRTMMVDQPKKSAGTATAGDLIEVGTYNVCNVDEVPGSVYTDADEYNRTLYARFRIVEADGTKTCNGDGFHVFGGNPDVSIDRNYMGVHNPDDTAESEPHVLELSATELPDAQVVTMGFDPTTAGGVGTGAAKDKSDSVMRLASGLWTNHNTNCLTFPDPEKADGRSKGWIYSPYYVGHIHPNWDPSSRSILDAPVFINHETKGILIHDRRYLSQRNPIDDPLVDGGGGMTLDSVFRDIQAHVEGDIRLEAADSDDNPRTASSLSGDEQAIFCSNGKPNIFNEASCKLSTSEDACVREDGTTDEDTVTVVPLSAEALAAMKEHICPTNTCSDLNADLLAKGVPLEVIGLVMTHDDGDARPCAMESVSRFMKDDTLISEDACLGETGRETLVGAISKAAFAHLLKYSVTNNPYLKDVMMYEAYAGMACHADDAEKINFNVWLTDTCYRHVHPQESNVYLITDHDKIGRGVDGELHWTDSPIYPDDFTMDEWATFSGKEYWGRKGDKPKLSKLMASLDVYGLAGGLDVTAAPTSTPSAPPSGTPSVSSIPTTSKSPVNARPSSEPTMSDMPSISSQPSSQPSFEPSSLPSVSSSPSSGPSTSEMPSDSPTIDLLGTSSPVPEVSSPSSPPSVSLQPSGQPSGEQPSMGPSMEPSQLSHVSRTISDGVFEAIANDALPIVSVVLETQLTQKSGGVLVCGSSGEIEADPGEDDYFDYWNWRLDSSGPESEQKKTVWTNIALTAEDQLCQRTAFALSQIFAISPGFLGYNSLSEAYTTFYDGFVRNCKSTYKNVLKTMAFSVKMGMQLSHAGSASVRTGYDRGGQIRFPDENFAREVMQLETVGLDMLNMDGTQIKDELGNTIPTYDTNDILTFARGWTGLDKASRRGNYEEKGPNKINWNDPMTLLDADRHDWFPKLNLLDGWIGDRYPLCYDLPAQAFLKKGAKYKLLGRSSSPRYQFDNPGWDGDEHTKKMTLSTASGLYGKLRCADFSCTYPTVVELIEDIACHGLECNVDTVRVVQVEPNVFYEYVRMPCVHHAFIEEGSSKKVFAGQSNGAAMCAHKLQPVATETCCQSDGSNSDIKCNYHGEYVTYATNTDRCAASDRAVCPAATNSISNQDKCSGQTGYNPGSPKYNHFSWTAGTCNIKVKVRLDGMVALVHSVPEAPFKVVKYVELGVGNMNFFHVPWPKDDYVKDELFPTIDNECGESTCAMQDDWTCLCDVTVTNTPAFSVVPTDAAEIRSKLKVGAFPQSLAEYDSGTILDGTVTVYHKKDASGNSLGYTVDTIFKLVDETDEFIDFGDEYYVDSGSWVGFVYLKNLESNIAIGDAANPYFSESSARKRLEMRNPLMFHDLVAPEIRDAHYEIDAIIHHLTSHPNAAPFISLQLIQHFGIANPSPGYIERVATVYKEGTYSDFGDGKFSNLEAVVAAILLDQEATSNTLDADPASGGIKEPILKVLQFMRALEYRQTPHDRNIYPKFSGMVAKVGQMAHESPDQFNFFLSDYSPPGPFAVGGIVAPPAQVLTLSTTVSTIEGFFSLARNGLSSQGEGFGSNVWGSQVLDAGDYSKSVGYLNYDTAGNDDAETVQKIADLLTSGRLSPEAVERIKLALTAIPATNKIPFIQQLIATAPEFHTTNLAERTGYERTPTRTQDRAEEPYKAIVILLASGGMDTFNVLTPHTTCALYKSYRQNREVLALKDTEMLPITITADNPDQPCDTFGVNSNIPILKTIYENSDGQFHAGIGHLSKPVTKGNWYTETQTHLFSHKTMEREAQLVDAFQEDGWSTGVGGRMLDVLQRRGLSVNAIGINGKGPILEGNPGLGRTVDVVSSSGVNTLNRHALDSTSNDLDSIKSLMEYLNEDTNLETSGVFADYWSQNLVDVLNKTDVLSTMLSSNQATLKQPYKFKSSIGRSLKVVAQLMLLNEERQVNRDVFLIHSGGHDGHSLSKENLQAILPGINDGIEDFYNEMILQDMIDDVTFVFLSEFGRTITPNSGLGSDHAWSGNAFVWGGQIDGAKIYGQYPNTFDNTDLANIGRGRLIPNRSWESMWYGIANWYGITDEEEMKTVLPNNGNMGCQLYTDKDMYTVGNTTVNGCNDRSISMKLSMLLNEPRYLTGIEQKKICKAAIFLTVQNANVTARCVVTDQKIIVHFDFNRRRILSPGDIDGRILTDVINITSESTVDFAYDNTEGSTDGTDYVENGVQFASDMDAQISGGANCAAGSSNRRRLNENACENAFENCAGVTEFEADVSQAPSLFPSTSSQPSMQPSMLPTLAPSLNPSLIPTPPAPSSKPSVAPSGRPTRDCPIVINECFNGGMWSTYTCECLCLSPHCPDAEDGQCTETSCPANYHESLFDDQPAPWFQFGASCTSTKEVPSTALAIYRNKEECCSSEDPANPGGCAQRPAAVLQLTFTGELQLDMVCPNSGSERVAAVANIASSVLTVLCSQAVGFTCSEGDKVVISKFCGVDYNIEVEYSSDSRRLQSLNTGSVQFAFIAQGLEYDELQGIETLLSAYLQGATLVSFLDGVLANILANDPTASLSAVTSLTYTALNAFIAGLGFYYPAWGYLETCLSDGLQDAYMNGSHGSWLYGTLESCCQRYYGWDQAGCKLRNAEATLVSGSLSSIVDPSDDLYFPDWERTDTCINDGTAPPYMKKQSSLWMYGTLSGCCRAHYGWEGGFVKCMTSQGGDPPTRSPLPESWYVDWKAFVCVESCEGASPCGGEHTEW
eukprot:CAMPEP_0172312770 /NCGR_PEP_ID=MMETSP1058-20130122/18549_1 /TAXON_ID=83371 /ORGANISM="Detonula confervacea, Strain CCMP 353" /LENGTH=2999 /DNA_ID=CAMNT_0013026315 /DNA_START=101 /DNA_END=9097 /DNA_ORIENTATION=+